MSGMLLADRYRVGRLLGEGGMGYVYEAVHLAIDKRFAIKVLAPEMCSRSSHVERFIREARTTSKIDHDNIVEITDCGPTPDGSVFFVMEYLQGEDLGALIDREGPQPWERTRKFMLQLCDALSAAHALGIVHRDIKPQNCFRTTRRGDPDFIKVLDFGIAKLLGEEHAAGKKLTRSGQIFGTPEYMSPEQIRGMPADPRMDVYAAGVIMYELLVGKTPFEGDAALEVLTKHVHDPIPEVGAAAVGESLAKRIDAVLAGALAKDASRRFQSADELAEAIKAIGAPGSTQKALDRTSLEGMPASLTGVRRQAAPSKGVVAVALVAGLVVIGGAAWALRAAGVFERADSSQVVASAAEAPTPADASNPEHNSEVGDGAPSDSPPVDVPSPTRPATPASDSDVLKAPAVAATPEPTPPAADASAEVEPRKLPAPAPTAKTTLKPKTPLSEVEKEVQRQVKARCWSPGGLVKWEKGETAKVTLTLQASTGKVTKVKVAYSNPAKGAIKTCIEQRLGQLAFPAGRAGDKYALDLKRSG